jgi:Protein of unknown function (DUF2946)
LIGINDALREPFDHGGLRDCIIRSATLDRTWRLKAEDRDRKTTADRGATRRELACSFGLLAVLFNLFTMILLVAAPVGGGASSVSAFGDRQVICTRAGMIVVDRDGNPTPDLPASPQHAQCIFCLPLMGGHVLVPAPADEPISLGGFLTIRNVVRQGATPLASSIESHRARGPPLAQV